MSQFCFIKSLSQSTGRIFNINIKELRRNTFQVINIGTSKGMKASFLHLDDTFKHNYLNIVFIIFSLTLKSILLSYFIFSINFRDMQ